MIMKIALFMINVRLQIDPYYILELTYNGELKISSITYLLFLFKSLSLTIELQYKPRTTV